jgi:hypothetical protein
VGEVVTSRARETGARGAIAAVTIGLGLVIHWHGAPLGPTARDVAGDALWAAMMFWLVSIVAPGVRWSVRGIIALCICFAVEESQRFRSPSLDTLRDTTMGHLVLGSGFDPRDFASYTAGVLAAMLLDRGLKRRGEQIPRVKSEARDTGRVRER